MNRTEGRPTVIMLVEDEGLVRMIAADILTDEGGFKVVEACDADEALRLVEARNDVRVLFTDVDMPGSLNGFALARLVDMRWPEIGIIVTSGQARPGPGDMPKKAEFLAKPYSPSALLKLVWKLLDRERPIIFDKGTTAGAPILPAGLKITQPHTGIGTAGGLAQPLPEADE